MITYNLTLNLPCASFFTGELETFVSHNIRLENEQEFVKVRRLCDNQKNMAPLWKQTVLPIRTDRFGDLIFPTLMNLVLKTKVFAEETFFVICAIVWDLLTFPIRVVTYLPRLVYNSMTKPDPHPLIKYLEGKGHSFSNHNEWTCGTESKYAVQKGGRVDILLYKQESLPPNLFPKKTGDLYTLYLTDREIAFPIYRRQWFVHSVTKNRLKISS